MPLPPQTTEDPDRLGTGTILVSPKATMGNYFNWQSGDRAASVGSIEAEKMLEGAIGELTEALKQGIDVFVEHLPDPANGYIEPFPQIKQRTGLRQSSRTLRIDDLSCNDIFA
jgi:hypothetical protein